MNGRESIWKRGLQSTFTQFVLVAAAVITIVTVALSHGVRDAIRDAAVWMYPNGVIALLGALVVVLAICLTWSRTRGRKDHGRVEAAESESTALREQIQRLQVGPSEEERRKDAATFASLTSTLPRPDISYWSELDFGGTWHGNFTHHLMQLLEDQNSVEDEFLDPTLEAARVELMVAARDLLQGCARWGVWARAGQGFYELGDADWVTNNAPEGPRSERFEEHRAELGCRADRLVVAYDALVRTPDSRAAGLRIASVVGMPVDQARTARAPPTGRCPIGRPGLRGGYDRAGPRARICLYEMTRGKSDPKPESMRVNQSG